MLPWLVALGPVALLAASLRPGPRVALVAGGLAFAAAVLAMLGLLAGGPVAHVFVDTGVAGIGLGIRLDAISAPMLLLVGFIGLIVLRFSGRYLDGDPGQGRYFAWACRTLAAVLALIVAGNLALFAVAWIATSLCLHQLLIFYPDRPRAVLAARKKFIVSRMGDACLVVALLLCLAQFGTLEFGAMRDAAAGQGGWMPGLFLALAALLKSAQFPVHGWLPEVMETPTPVSALLHAGIINAGGYLLLRMADVLVQSPVAMDLLILVGGATALFASAVMLTQTSIKVSLAWSTLAQMGFMILQCGLGAFSAAMLHILAHALYKAHGFLSAGSVVAEAARPMAQAAPPAASWRACGLAALGVVLGLAAGLSPAVILLGAMLLVGLGPFMTERRDLGFGAGVVLAWVVLQAAAAWALADALPRTAEIGVLGWLLAGLVLAGSAALVVLQSRLRRAPPGPRLRALHVHLSNGFYINAMADRLLAKGARS